MLNRQTAASHPRRRRLRRPALRRRHHQRGAVAIIAALSAVTLVLMLGLVLDLGHLFVVKNELQNAADACALSGTRELNDLSTGTLERATHAALTAGNRNRVDLQRDAVAIDENEVTFSDQPGGPWARAVTATTTYVRCAPHEQQPKSVTLWFMAVTGLAGKTLSAVAIARLVGGQSLCAIPVAMCTMASPATPNLGFTTGTWYSGRLAAGAVANGNYEWVRFPAQQGGGDLGAVLAGAGSCDLGPAVVDAEPGVSTGVAQAWNSRFGLYSGSYKDMDSFPPDRTGWAYTANRLDKKGGMLPGSWPAAAPQNAYADYLLRKNNTHDPYNPAALLDDNGKPSNLPGNPSPLARELHAGKGQDRRMTFVPVIGCQDWAPNKKNMVVLDYACAFMISPINDPNADVQLEFRGLKSSGACASSGAPGDTGAPVAALVQ